MLATNSESEKRYDLIRKASLSAISSQIDPSNDIDFRLVDREALKAAENWKISPNRKVDWEWEHYYSFKSAYPNRFELALWHHSNLASLSLGRPTYQNESLRLDFIEKNPDHVDIKVFQITLAAMSVYADAIGAQELRVMNPINEEVKAYYEKFGLTYVANGDYLVTRI